VIAQAVAKCRLRRGKSPAAMPHARLHCAPERL